MHLLKATEQSSNVCENKCSAWKEREEAGLSKKPKGGHTFVDGILCFKVDNLSANGSERGVASFEVTERSLNVYENKWSA